MAETDNDEQKVYVPYRQYGDKLIECTDSKGKTRMYRSLKRCMSELEKHKSCHGKAVEIREFTLTNTIAL